MITFYTEIIERIKTGSIKNVVLFGDSLNRPKTPFVVVKPIASGDRKVLQIIAHSALGTHEKLEGYIMRELPYLLKEPLEAEGKRIQVISSGAWIGPYIDEGDNTLAMTRDFYVPVII